MGALRLTYHNSNLRASSSLELSNHLGNVLSVISDKVIPHVSGGSVAYYKADILQAQDYSPFGVKLKGRNLNKTGNTELYRSGFQGQEEDDELKGDGNSVNYEYRMHDPRLGRFFAIDPLASKFPWNSSYAFSANRLLDAIELEGKEAYFIHGTKIAWLGIYAELVHSKQMKEEDLVRIGQVFGNIDINRDFDWTGLNYDYARQLAGLELALHIAKTADKEGDQPVTLIGHSHGGNVAIQAVNILVANGWKPERFNIVAVNTPRESDIELENSKTDLYAVSAI
jgi:RHS repeat-associated protein